MPTNYHNIFSDILLENAFKTKSTYLKRGLEVLQNKTKAVIVTGVRRSGKTTTLQEIHDKLMDSGIPSRNLVYCNFSDERLIGIQAKELGMLLEAYAEYNPAQTESNDPAYLFLDEIQLVQGWEYFVDRILRSKKYFVTISGSSAKMLSKEIATAMRGRSISYEVFPFSFSEFMKWNQIELQPPFSQNIRIKLKKCVNEYLIWGGFPEVVQTQDQILKRKIIQEYLDGLLFKDIVERGNFPQPQLAKFLFTLLISMSAQNFTLNKTHAKLKSLGYRTDKMLISDFMSLCEDCYSLFKVELYSESVAKRATNPKKLYCVDNGLPTLTGRAFSDNRGRLLENAVFVSLRRKGIPIHYYRSRSGFEIDFLIMDQNENLMLIQVCDSLENEEARNRELRAFVEAGKELKSKFQIIITSNETDLIRLGRQKIQIMPIWDFFLKLEAEAPPFRLTTHP